MNSYEAYKIPRTKWKEIKEDVKANMLNSQEVAKKHDLDSVQVWFLYTKLLQNNYNKLYIREPLTDEDIKVGQYVYCDFEGFGRGEIVHIFPENNGSQLMEVKFVGRSLPTMCDAVKKITVHDGTKRKITKL